MKEIINYIEQLFIQNGNEAYFGEEINQFEHAAQCYLLAEKTGSSNAIQIAAFLHDIGHMIAEDQEGFGRIDHDLIGANWLAKSGFEPLIVATVRHHVNAKRYLCFKNHLYFSKLSEASVYTLSKQGGVMTHEEASAFEKELFFNEIIQLRHWDEQAKEIGLELPTLKFFLNKIETYLNLLK